VKLQTTSGQSELRIDAAILGTCPSAIYSCHAKRSGLMTDIRVLCKNFDVLIENEIISEVYGRLGY
jgi:hypothetical protein